MKLFQNPTGGFRGRTFYDCLENSIWLPWQPEFLMKLNSVNIFKRDLPRKISTKFG